jgi:hypothetical protein
LLLEERPTLSGNLKVHQTDKFTAAYFQPALPIDAHSIDMNLEYFSLGYQIT